VAKAARERAEQEAAAQRKAEEARKTEQEKTEREAAAQRKAEEQAKQVEEAAREQAEQEAAAQKKAEEQARNAEESARRKAEQERVEQEAAAARKNADEEARKAEAAAREKTEQEASAQKKAEEQARQAEEAAREQAEQEAAAQRKVEEAAREKAEQEAAAQRKAEEATCNKAEQEKAEQEAGAWKKAEEAARKRVDVPVKKPVAAVPAAHVRAAAKGDRKDSLGAGSETARMRVQRLREQARENAERNAAAAVGGRLRRTSSLSSPVDVERAMRVLSQPTAEQVFAYFDKSQDSKLDVHEFRCHFSLNDMVWLCHYSEVQINHCVRCLRLGSMQAYVQSHGPGDVTRRDRQIDARSRCQPRQTDRLERIQDALE
jgi:hypothetical protein